MSGTRIFMSIDVKKISEARYILLKNLTQKDMQRIEKELCVQEKTQAFPEWKNK